MKELLAQILLSAADEMWMREPTLGKYTAETAEHELNLAFHYAAGLRDWFPWLHCDFDLTKLNFNRERPDIILHRRQSSAANFLVIEVKREQSRKDVPDDWVQIRTRWFKGKLRYRYGASLILDELDHRAVEARVLFRDSEAEVIQKLNELPRLQLRKPLAVQKASLNRLVDQTVKAKRANPNADTATLEREIDRQVCALYGFLGERDQNRGGASQ